MRIKIKKSYSEKKVRNLVRRARVRKKIVGRSKCPRLSVNFSLKTVYTQIIDDSKGVTLVSAYLGKDGTNSEAAKKAGQAIAKKAKEKKITQVVFDRGAKTYSGRNAVFAQAVREAGLKL